MESSSISLDDPRVLRGAAPLDVAPAPPGSVTTLPQLFQHVARIQPDAVAFSCQTGDAGLRKITYAEADAIARTLAESIARISCNNLEDGSDAPRVAIWFEKGLELILAILSTTYSGATWLPFDPDVPTERATVCCENASATAILCDAAHLERARDVQRRIGEQQLRVSTFSELATDAKSFQQPPSSCPRGPRPQDAAYLIYTSGTTGTPKGIAIPHSAALTFSLSEREVLQTSPQDIVWNGFSPAFDMFVEEMWVTVAGGGHLTTGTRAECNDIPGLPAIWRNRGVTLVNAVPSLIGIMGITQVDDSPLLPPSVRLINVGGEACPPSLVERLARPGLRIINTYGPTETTVTATFAELRPGVTVTIGKPLPSYHACLLPISEDGSPVPNEPLRLAEGIEGELAIGGPCVGLGYVGRAELTAEKFIRHPLALTSGERLYRSGDRVKLDANMDIVYLGRIDTQVKHRGFRIELGEIESVLSSHEDILAAAVILANPGTDAARLEAFVVIRAEAERDSVALQKVVTQRLPSYMLPEQIWFLTSEEMPRLPSGKINGKALHALSVIKAAELATSATNEEQALERDLDVDAGSPLGILLTTLALVFPQGGRIKPEADFFDDLGGHSLSAAVLVSRLRKAVDENKTTPFASLGLSDIYEGRTAANIASKFTVADESKRSGSLTDSEDWADVDSTGPHTGEHLPVSQTKFVLCGLAQLLPLLFLFFVHSVEILVPYLLFDYLVVTRHIGWAVLAAYGVFIAVPPFLAIVAVVGKWLILGKAKPGEYPLYGVYYFRWWAAERLAALANPKLVADSGLYPHFLRAMGAKVGKYCHIGALALGSACDLVEIGDDVVIGADVVLAVSLVERGKLILKKVVIQDNAIIGSNSVIEGGAIIGDCAEVAALSMVPDGMEVPTMQRFHGSPARLERVVKESQAALGAQTRPSAARATAMLVGNMFITGFVLPLLYFAPQIPGLMLFDVLDLRKVGEWGQVAVLSIPIAFAYQFLVFGQLLLFRKIVLGQMKEGTYKLYSNWYLRKWFVERLMDLALDVLHPVFATLYIVPFLRALGVKIGKRAEISTARGLMFELLEIGEESFVADAVMIGDTEVRGNELTLKKTRLEARAFAGNASLIPQGTQLESGCLVGVLSIAPPADKPLAANTSCFGSPPVRMPARHHAEGHADNLLFYPSTGRIAARLLIEGLRIVMPRAIIIFGLGFALQVAYLGYHGIGAVYTLLMLPAFYFFMFALPSLMFTALLKWILIGRYKDSEWPLWSLNVWLSEAVTSTWETIAEPLLGTLLVGTPYLAWCFRLLGVKIGSRVTLLASDITEYDCVSIGDEAMINQRCGSQTHLFEDRIMKVGRVTLGKRACLKPYSICLPGSSLSDGAQLGCLSLVMKGENLPENTAWEGAPVAPRKARKRTPAKGGVSIWPSNRNISTAESQASKMPPSWRSSVDNAASTVANSAVGSKEHVATQMV